jgi:hypothetical protein
MVDLFSPLPRASAPFTFRSWAHHASAPASSASRPPPTGTACPPLPDAPARPPLLDLRCRRPAARPSSSPLPTVSPPTATPLHPRSRALPLELPALYQGACASLRSAPKQGRPPGRRQWSSLRGPRPARPSPRRHAGEQMRRDRSRTAGEGAGGVGEVGSMSMEGAARRLGGEKKKGV